MSEPPITELERQVLDLYSCAFAHEGNRVRLLREKVGLSEVAALQLLNGLIDTERALCYSPIVVKRLRRLRDSRKRSRYVA